MCYVDKYISIDKYCQAYLSIINIAAYFPVALIEANVVRIIKQQLVEVFWGYNT